MAKKPKYFAAAQMSNKAVGYMAAGSAAHQLADFDKKKEEALKAIEQRKKDKERRRLTARQKVELDSLNRVGEGQDMKAKELYGSRFVASPDGYASSDISDFNEEGKKQFSKFYNESE